MLLWSIVGIVQKKRFNAIFYSSSANEVTLTCKWIYALDTKNLTRPFLSRNTNLWLTKISYFALKVILKDPRIIIPELSKKKGFPVLFFTWQKRKSTASIKRIKNFRTKWKSKQQFAVSLKFVHFNICKKDRFLQTRVVLAKRCSSGGKKTSSS